MTPHDEPAVTVLVVDDDPQVLNVLTLALQTFGLAVVPTDNGEEAVHLLRTHLARIDVALLDVQTSPWDGPRTLAELRQLAPALPAAFMSGDTGRYARDDLLALGAARMFSKPFPNFAALAAALRAMAAAPHPVGQ